MKSNAKFAPSQWVEAIETSVASVAKAGLILQAPDATNYEGRSVQIDGRELRNFGGCSYLGLEQRQQLREGAIDAIRRYGTQFSFSRMYLESPLYRELETALAEMTGGHVLVTPTTTLGHIAALPVLVGPRDAVVVDQYAHASLHTAISLLRDVPVHVVRHNRMDSLDTRISRLAATHERVWYVHDGLYSMLGDFAPWEGLNALMRKHACLHVYCDDAHSTSWCGANGRGQALEHIEDRERTVVALSLNKAFSAGGGALVLPERGLRDRVQRCGGPMIFSGPLQPPMLGAAVASARLHLSDEFADIQQQERERIEQVLTHAAEAGLRLACWDESPIFFLRCGPEETTYAMVGELRERGFYVCPSVFPAVSHKRSGIRFTVAVYNSAEDISDFMSALVELARQHGLAETDPEALDAAS